MVKKKRPGMIILVCCLTACLIPCCQGERAEKLGSDASNDTAARAGENIPVAADTPVTDKEGVVGAGDANISGGSGGPSRCLAIRIVLATESEAETESSGEFAATLLVTAPDGRRTGTDALTGESFDEIPRSAHYDEAIEDPAEGGAGAAWRIIEINVPASGRYPVAVQGTGGGIYGVSFVRHDEPEGSSLREFIAVPIRGGTVHTYALDIGEMMSPGSWVRGGYDGGGDDPAGADRLLSYANVTGERTDLRGGTHRVALFVVYAGTIDPDSVHAGLDGVDISDGFSPRAVGSEIVDVPLRAGENVLTLSIEGIAPGGGARGGEGDGDERRQVPHGENTGTGGERGVPRIRDVDRLVFHVGKEPREEEKR